MTTKREPLLSDDALSDMAFEPGGTAAASRYAIGSKIRDHYEAARAKDAELIHQLVDALAPLHGTLSQTVFYDSFPAYVLPIDAALESAAAAGFTPSEQ